MKKTFDFELDGYPDQTFRVVLDSITYELGFVWNERDESWQFSLGSVGSAPMFTCKLTGSIDILAQYHHIEGVPNGKLVLLPLQDPRDRVGRYNIGIHTAISMYYLSRDEDVAKEE